MYYNYMLYDDINDINIYDIYYISIYNSIILYYKTVL